MPLKILVFSELFSRLPDLELELAALGLEVARVNGGREALAAVQADVPAALFLSAAMPELSGIESCRKIKAALGDRAPALFLYSDLASPALAERAAEAGCDLLVQGPRAQARVAEFLRKRLMGEVAADSSATSEQERRQSRRMEVTQVIRFTWNGEEHEGWLMNASRSGVLFASSAAVGPGQEVVLHLGNREGEGTDVPCRVVRTVALKTPEQGHPYAVGARFGELGGEERQRLDAALVAMLKASRRVPRIPLALAREILEGDLSLLANAFAAGDGSSKILEFLGPSPPFEREAWSGRQGAAWDCARRLIFLRLQCLAAAEVVPLLRGEPSLIPLFLDRVTGLLSRIDAIESETEAFVREAVAAGEEEIRSGLNDSSSRMHETKKLALFSIADRITAHGLGAEAGTLKTIQNRAAQLRRAPLSEESVKYDRRPLAAPEPEAEKEKIVKARRFRLGWKSALAAGLLLLAGSGAIFGRFFASRVSPTELEVPMRVSSIRIDREAGLIIHVSTSAWTDLDGAQREKTYEAIENFMKRKKIRTARLLGDDRKPLAAVLSSGAGGGIVFQRKAFAK